MTCPATSLKTPVGDHVCRQALRDLVTPYSNSRYVLNHIPPNVEGERAELKLYRGGHMFYTDPQSRKAFTTDARTMYASP